MKVAVFSTKSYEKALLAKVSETSELKFTYFTHSLNAITATLGDKFEAICVFVNDDVNSQVVNMLAKQNIRHIALRCAGYNNVDIETASRNGIRVSRVPSYAPEAVAEHAVALIMTLNRKIHKAYNRIREGNFELNGLMGFNLKNKRVGVIGTGHIGKALVTIMRGFGCEVICCDPVPSPEIMDMGVTYVDLDRLLTQSDIVSLHCPLNEKTYHLINQTSISRMRDGVMLINTSRGGLVDSQAVIKGLKSGKIGYLGLDVYEMESDLFFENRSTEIIGDDVFERLATFHNVIITGHQGFFTLEAMNEIASTVVANLVTCNTPQANPENFLV
ncbi:2-hydroxyacid dehydrogenase [Alteromonas ponticola]|uniref:2-hydroxyacid dehydrogenase n=1 Tax=Alteromonas aquimaris TaxID=2998417 RepID=A0ABT3P660_9ALTE|nr:2-hydroxyacid dehydrogenase [Alteromonas aquimaris]MCW8107566.1 2-hydroxyacid dehydrogenase [Alteromonas aquimaris]